MLIDTKIEKTLKTDGYAVVGKIKDEDLARLHEYHQGTQRNNTNFYYSLLNNNYKTNREIQDIYKAILSSFFKEYFSNYRIITESYLVKPAHSENELLIHQDWCYTDEQKYQAYNVWIPLSDVNEENEPLFFLKGSNLWFNNKRSGSLPTARISSNNYVIAKNIITIPVQKGEVIVFHPAVFHGSHPNKSEHDRIIVTATIMDKNAPFLYYQKVNENLVEIFQLEDERFIKDLEPLTKGERPDNKPLDRIEYSHVVVTEEMITEKLAAQN